MKRYPEYKDTGIDWIGEIPFSWQVKRLKFLAKNVICKTSPYQNTIALENIESGTGKYVDSKNDSILLGDVNQFCKRDILFNKLRPYLAKVFYAEQDGTSVGELLVLRAEDDIYPKFLFYRLLSRDFIEVVNGSTYGAKMPRASWDDFIKNQLVPFPNFSDQCFISSFLDHKIDQIENLISKKKKLIVLLQEERAAIINQAVTKGLNPDVPMKDSGIEWLGEIPEHWEINKLCYLTNRIGDGIHTTPEYIEKSEYAFINGNNLVDGAIVLGESARYVQESEFVKYHRPLNERTLLMSINGTIGNSAFYRNEKVILGKSAAFINCKEIINIKYLYFLFQSERMKFYLTSQLSGTTIFNLSLKTLNNSPIPFPTEKEQDRIASYIENMNSHFESTISRILKGIEFLTEYKISLINEAVTGKIDVRDYPVNHA